MPNGRTFTPGGPQPAARYEQPLLQRLRLGAPDRYGDVLGTRRMTLQDAMRDFAFLAGQPRRYAQQALVERNQGLQELYLAAQREERVARTEQLRYQLEAQRVRNETANRIFDTIKFSATLDPDLRESFLRDTFSQMFPHQKVMPSAIKQIARDAAAHSLVIAYGPDALRRLPQNQQAAAVATVQGWETVRRSAAEAARAEVERQRAQLEAAQARRATAGREHVEALLAADLEPTDDELLRAGFTTQDITRMRRMRSPTLTERERLGVPRLSLEERAAEALSIRRGPGPRRETGITRGLRPSELRRIVVPPPTFYERYEAKAQRAEREQAQSEPAF